MVRFKLDQRLHILLTLLERELLEQVAEKRGMTSSQVVRDLIRREAQSELGWQPVVLVPTSKRKGRAKSAPKPAGRRRQQAAKRRGGK
jgi:predicted pyridoxine 5'-phosphate oxidase superfamily flavin-nucleotide-binding protein